MQPENNDGIVFLMDLVLGNLTLSRNGVQFQQENILPNRSEMLKKKKKKLLFVYLRKKVLAEWVDSFLSSWAAPQIIHNMQ